MPLSPQLTFSIVALCNHLSRSLVRKVRLRQEDSLVSTLRAKIWQVKSPAWAQSAGNAASSSSSCSFSIGTLRVARIWPTLGPAWGPRCPRPAGLQFLVLLSAIQHPLGGPSFPSMLQKLAVQDCPAAKPCQQRQPRFDPGEFCLGAPYWCGQGKDPQAGPCARGLGLSSKRGPLLHRQQISSLKSKLLCFSAVAKVTRKTCPAERQHPIVS